MGKHKQHWHSLVFLNRISFSFTNNGTYLAKSISGLFTKIYKQAHNPGPLKQAFLFMFLIHSAGRVSFIHFSLTPCRCTAEDEKALLLPGLHSPLASLWPAAPSSARVVFPFRISEGHSNSAQCITSGHFALLSDDNLGMFVEIQKIKIFSGNLISSITKISGGQHVCFFPRGPCWLL